MPILYFLSTLDKSWKHSGFFFSPLRAYFKCSYLFFSGGQEVHSIVEMKEVQILKDCFPVLKESIVNLLASIPYVIMRKDPHSFSEDLQWDWVRGVHGNSLLTETLRLLFLLSLIQFPFSFSLWFLVLPCNAPPTLKSSTTICFRQKTKMRELFHWLLAQQTVFGTSNKFKKYSWHPGKSV